MGFWDMKETITPKVIKVLWVIGIILAILFGVIGFISSLIAGQVGMAFVILISAALGLLFYRIYLEVIVVLFNIEKNTRKKK